MVSYMKNGMYFYINAYTENNENSDNEHISSQN